jgi:hypothetical protein
MGQQYEKHGNMKHHGSYLYTVHFHMKRVKLLIEKFNVNIFFFSFHNAKKYNGFTFKSLSRTESAS